MGKQYYELLELRLLSVFHPCPSVARISDHRWEHEKLDLSVLKFKDHGLWSKCQKKFPNGELACLILECGGCRRFGLEAGLT